MKNLRTYNMTPEQRKVLIKGLSEVHDQNGEFNLTIQIDDDLEVIAKGFVELDGYVEDDYFNGTGGYVETFRVAHVELSGFDGEQEVWIDDESEGVADEYLNAA